MARDCSLCAAVVGSSDPVISPCCWPAALGSAKPNREESSVSDGQRGGRDAASSGGTCHADPAPERRGGKRSAGVCCTGSALAGDSSVSQNDREKGGGEINEPFFFSWGE